MIIYMDWPGFLNWQTKLHAELLKCEHSVTLDTRLELSSLLIWAFGVVVYIFGLSIEWEEYKNCVVAVHTSALTRCVEFIATW